MYKRVRLKDTVEVPPEELGDVTPNLVKRLLQDKLEGRMDEEVGSVVSITDVKDIGEGTVLPNRPGVYYEAEFNALTFDPQMQEVVDGTIVEVVEFGAFVGIGPVDGLLHVSQISDPSTACSTSLRSRTSISPTTGRTSGWHRASRTRPSASTTLSGPASSRRASTSATHGTPRSA